MLRIKFFLWLLLVQLALFSLSATALYSYRSAIEAIWQPVNQALEVIK